MRTILNVICVLLALTGIVWTLQGAGMLGGSFMTGERRWFWIGLGCVLVGILVLVFNNRSTLHRRS